MKKFRKKIANINKKNFLKNQVFYFLRTLRSPSLAVPSRSVERFFQTWPCKKAFPL